MFFLRLKNTQGTIDFTFQQSHHIAVFMPAEMTNLILALQGEKHSSTETFFLRIIKITFSQSQIKLVVAWNAAFMHRVINFSNFWCWSYSPTPSPLSRCSHASPLQLSSLHGPPSSGALTCTLQTEDHNERQGANYFNSLRSPGLTVLSG